MVKILQGDLVAKGIKVGIVVGRFNEFISNKLLDGALDTLKRHGVGDNDITVAWAPGSFELPVVAKKFASSSKFNAVICLGAVIKGETPHFNYVSAEVSKGVAQVGLETGVPTIFGVVTADTLEQAIQRAGAKSGNKGSSAAEAAIEMVNLLKQIK